MKEQNFDTAFEEVKKLVAKFKQGEKHYLQQDYSEAAVRQDFLDDFFTALGWDVRHQIQHDPYEQEVKIERGVKISGAQKRADYSFSIAPNFRDPKFFAEAKKPAKALKNAQDYFQSIRYGWHKGHLLSILTDFEEFHIIDCRYTPDINNSLDKCYKRFHYTDYLNKEKFAEIYFLFSREAVANNSIEKVAETLPKRKGKATTKTLFPLEIHQTIDEAFLEVIDGIREKLAKAFKKQDENLTSEELTEATQRTVDRLVFIRFLEDKLIEQEHWVSEFGEKGSVWNDFISACRKLDAKYNGIVFKEHFIDRQNFAGADENEFRTICQDICHLNSRFLFNEIPIHILGSIYERFLGKVVHATAKRVTVEEKPEVQKAGGVYYTPKYIVDYIVRNTVGKLIEGKTPEQISKLRFADIACGSGSFLIGVFDCLLDHHNKYYQKHPDKAKKDKCIEKDGLWVMSIKQKQKILLNNIYGVDIDQQATEVTQLSLALKMMEDETTATANDMLVLFHEKILPDMSKNIICGNSLIGTDILTQNLFAGDEERKLNPMNYEDVFKEIMQNGGFDAIVGNPPYSLIGTDRKFEQDYYTSGKFELTSYKINTYLLFLEQGLKLLNPENGILGFIIPKSLVFNTYFDTTRKKLLQDYSIPQIVEIREKVFKTAEVGDSILFFGTKSKKSLSNILHYHKVENITPTFQLLNSYKTKQEDLLKDFDGKFFPSGIKVKIDSEPLDSFCYVFNGLNPGNVRHILLTTSKKKNKHKKMVLGRDIQRYELEWSGTWVNYDSTLKNRLKPSDIKSKVGMTAQNKVDFALRNEEIYLGDKIFVRKTADHIVATLDLEEYYYDSLSYGIKLKDETKYSLYFILGLLNSKLLNYFHDILSDNKDKVFAKVLATNISKLPIPKINFQNKTEKVAHDKIVSLVEQMLQATKEVDSAKTDKDKTYSERKCSSLDTAIDTEVYKLYDLSEEEIKIVEGK